MDEEDEGRAGGRSSSLVLACPCSRVVRVVLPRYRLKVETRVRFTAVLVVT